jgi:hypothetical protein
VDLGLAMVAHSPAPHGPTFTCAPSCASQRPLGSADAEPAQNGAKIVTAAAAQSLGSFMLPIFVSPGRFEQAQILTYRRLARQKKVRQGIEHDSLRRVQVHSIYWPSRREQAAGLRLVTINRSRGHRVKTAVVLTDKGRAVSAQVFGRLRRHPLPPRTDQPIEPSRTGHD